jgi:Thiol:disulfide interchange protein DsbD, N-terminal
VLPVFLVFAIWMTSTGPGGEPVSTKHLTIATSASKDAVAPGARVALNIDIAPKPTMHVYAPGQKNYIAVSLTLEGNPAIKPAAIQFPPPEKREVKELGETQLVYSRPFRIIQAIAVATAPSVRPGPLTVKGAVKYQACDESICYAPITVPVTWTLTVKKPSGR